MAISLIAQARATFRPLSLSPESRLRVWLDIASVLRRNMCFVPVRR